LRKDERNAWLSAATSASEDFLFVVYRAPASGTRSRGSCTGSHDDWLACVTHWPVGYRGGVTIFSKWRRGLSD